LSISDEHLQLTSRITEGKEEQQEQKREEMSRNIRTDFQPSYINSLITNQFDFNSFIHLKRLLRSSYWKV